MTETKGSPNDMPLTEDLSRLRYVAGVDKQAGAFAWLPHTDPIQFVIVTSRRTKRWVFPKGAVDFGMTPPEAASQEAVEEAGVLGTVSDTAIGYYRTPKIRPPLIWTVEVALYPIRIDEVLDQWIEADQRQRAFVTLNEARSLITDRDMLSIAERFLDSLDHA